MARLILHAGTHKTGTTAIQTFAVQNREALLRRGLLYPDFRPYPITLRSGHHQFAHSLAEAPEARMSRRDVRELVGRWRAVAEDQGLDLLVSVEALYRHQSGEGNTPNDRRRHFLQGVAEVLHGFDVTLVLVFRRPDNFVRSLYQEYILSHTPRPSHPSLYKWATDSGRFEVGYTESASLFQDVFPNVRFLLYEDLILGKGLYTNFFAHLGIDVSNFPTPGRIRVSANAPQTVAKNYASDFLRDKPASREFMAWMQSNEVAERIEQAFGGTRFDLWASHEERLAFLSSRADDLERLRSTFFPDREQLFPPLRPGETLPPVPELPLEIQDLVDQYLRKKGLA